MHSVSSANVLVKGVNLAENKLKQCLVRGVGYNCDFVAEAMAEVSFIMLDKT